MEPLNQSACGHLMGRGYYKEGQLGDQDHTGFHETLP